MAELTPQQQALVRAGREALKPTAADRERVSSALAAHLGDGVLGEAGADPSLVPTPATTATPALPALTKALIALGGASCLGAVLWLSLPATPAPMPTQQPMEQPSKQPSELSTAPRSLAEPADGKAAQAPTAEESVAAAQVEPVAPAGARDSHAQEVAILSRASSKLYGGQPTEALAILSEHRRRFPDGVLAQERMAARVQALCALGRVDEATSDLEALAKRAPNSPLEARARKACGALLDR